MTVDFTDQSTASPTEKARRVPTHLANPKDPRYFFDDGFPRAELHQDAAAALAVLNSLAKQTASVVASCSVSGD